MDRFNDYVMKTIARYPDFAGIITAVYNEGLEDGKNNAISSMGNMLNLLQPITGDPETDKAIRQARGDDFETQIRQRTTGDPDIDAAIAAMYPDGKRVSQ